jgi:hypothetical protein
LRIADPQITSIQDVWKFETILLRPMEIQPLFLMAGSVMIDFLEDAYGRSLDSPH